MSKSGTFVLLIKDIKKGVVGNSEVLKSKFRSLPLNGCRKLWMKVWIFVKVTKAQVEDVSLLRILIKLERLLKLGLKLHIDGAHIFNVSVALGIPVDRLVEAADSALILRLFIGYGIGIISYVVPVYIAEMAPKNLRGMLATTNQVKRSVIHWRQLALAGLVPCISLLVGSCFIPESPRWLAKVGREKEFQFKYFGANMLIFLMKLLKYRIILKLFKNFLRLRCWTCSRARFYTAEIFVAAGLSSAKAGTIAYACIQVPFTMLGAILMDKSRRKPLITINLFANNFCEWNILRPLYYRNCFLFQGNLLLEWVPTLAVGGILIYIAIFSIGLGSVPWVMMSEVFPINLKGIG
ncbi:unnamed protein product [Vicia faba]|uniref:Uncharacterized protein n=1 Tax=Vicia faba TaxID=3906 RepID=A0AAV1A729_VICFA|nr:unnamed protein product [Vicia faba]